MKLLSSIVLSGVILYANQIIEMTQQQANNLGVKIQAVKKVKNIQYGPYNGKVVLDNKDIIVVGSNIESAIQNIYVRKFQEVKKGEKLLSIRSNELLNLQKEYIQALIESKNINETYERNTKLQSQGIISEKNLIFSKKEKENADLQIKLAKNYLLASGFSKSMLKKIQKSHIPIMQIDIRAPKDGVISEINVNVGEVVKSDKNMLTLYADGERFIELFIPVKMIDTISLGDSCSFDSYKASVTNIGRVISNTSQSVEVRASVEDAKDIVVNRIYDVKLFKEVHNSVKIKKSALVYDGNEAVVFKKVSNGYEVIEVEIVNEGPTCYIVKGLLQDGDKLAVSSTSALLSGMESEDE